MQTTTINARRQNRLLVALQRVNSRIQNETSTGAICTLARRYANLLRAIRVEMQQ